MQNLGRLKSLDKEFPPSLLVFPCSVTYTHPYAHFHSPEAAVGWPNVSSTHRIMDRTGLQYGTEILGSGLMSGPAGDKIGLFHGGMDRDRTLEGSLLNFTY